MPLNDIGKLSDSALYREFLAGDTASYDQLMIRLGDSLIRYLYGYLHDWDEAEDMMIEAFARIMAKRPRIADGAFKSYLYRTGRNLALRFRENKNRAQVFSLDGMDSEAAAGTGTAGTGMSPVEEEVVNAEQTEALYRCLDRIEPELREALWLVYLEGLSYAQAAAVMKVREKRIERLLARGKKQMKTELEKEGITDLRGI